MEKTDRSAQTCAEAHKPDRAPWVRPEIRKLGAGAAEFGGDTSTDNGVSFS